MGVMPPSPPLTAGQQQQELEGCGWGVGGGGGGGNGSKIRTDGVGVVDLSPSDIVVQEQRQT